MGLDIGGRDLGGDHLERGLGVVAQAPQAEDHLGVGVRVKVKGER